MNISELARQLRTTSQELKDVLPEFGFSIGQRAIKIDDKIAQRVMKEWPQIKRTLQKRKQEEEEALKPTIQAGELEKVVIPEVLTVGEFAKALSLPVTTVITELMKSGILATINERIDFETASIIAEDLGKEVIVEEGSESKDDEVELATLEEKLSSIKTDKAEGRPPVIVILGHVDHGKTTLLDTIRETSVVSTESGGITQHIGAYQVEKNGKKITFIDTPGHEAFTAMRSRGAKIADIAILVVAADDSVKPQTIECIHMIQSTKLPVIVAVNKMDKEDVNPDKVKTDLSHFNLIPEEWGGKTIMIPVSALKKQGIDELLENILLVADMQQESIVADPNGPVMGVVIESHVDSAEGPVATILVKSGTLRLNDQLCLDDVIYGKVRIMKDHLGHDVKEALPSTPVRISGLKTAPHVGDVLEVYVDSKGKRKYKSKQMSRESDEKMVSIKGEEKKDDDKSTLNVILKTDTLGSLEAIMQTLQKVPQNQVSLHVVYKGLGHITESDIIRAQTSNAFICGFKVNIQPAAQDLLHEQSITLPEHFEVKRYEVIYELFDDIKQRMEAMIQPDIVREDQGDLEVLAVFKKVSGGVILGGKVIDGAIQFKKDKTTFVEIRQDESVIGHGKLRQLQANKQDTAQVKMGQECGMNVETSTPIENGMTLHFYFEKEEKKHLE